MRVFAALVTLLLAGPAAAREPPLPDLSTARCFETSLMIRLYLDQPYKAPKEFAGTPWEQSGRVRHEIEKAEQRREFLRDCSRLGYRIPATVADETHNKALSERQSRDWERMYDAAARWYASRRDPNVPSRAAQGIPPIEPSPEQVEMEQCRDSFLFAVSLPANVRDTESSFPSSCRKYGFAEGRDAAADARNRRVWERMNDDIARLKKKDSQSMMRMLVGAP